MYVRAVGCSATSTSVGWRRAAGGKPRDNCSDWKQRGRQARRGRRRRRRDGRLSLALTSCLKHFPWITAGTSSLFILARRLMLRDVNHAGMADNQPTIQHDRTRVDAAEAIPSLRESGHFLENPAHALHGALAGNHADSWSQQSVATMAEGPNPACPMELACHPRRKEKRQAKAIVGSRPSGPIGICARRPSLHLSWRWTRLWGRLSPDYPLSAHAG